MSRVPSWAAPARARIPEPTTWQSMLLRVMGVLLMALLWWALSFLAWQSAGVPTMFESLRPTLPVLLADLQVAVFGPLGASLMVIALFRRWGLAFMSVSLGFVVSAVVTLTRGVSRLDSVSPEPFYVNPTERTIMLVVIAVMALAGLGVGVFAIGSLQRFGFLGLLAVTPVVLLLAAILVAPRADTSWLTRSALVTLLVMIAWRRWSGVLFWPGFFALYWLLTLAMVALGTSAQTLRPRGGGTSVGLDVEAMLATVRSAWRVLLGISWDIFWPAAVIAALVIVGQYAWRRFGQVGT